MPAVLADFTVSPDVTTYEVWQLYKRVRRLKTSYIADVEKRLKYVPDVMASPIKSLTKGRVLTLYEHIRESAGDCTAGYVFRILRALVEFAKETLDTADGAPLLTANCVKVLSATRLWPKAASRTDYLKPSEMKPWLTAVLRYPNQSTSDWLLFVLLTGCRRNEGTRLLWQDVNFQDALVTFRSTKNGRHHAIPVSSVLLHMLKRRWLGAGTNPYVFTGLAGGKLSDWSKAYLDVNKDAGVSVTVHGLRRTYATIADSLDIPKSAIAQLLNHSPRSVTDTYIQPSHERLRRHTEAITQEIMRLAEAPQLTPLTEEATPCLPYLKTLETSLTTYSMQSG